MSDKKPNKPKQAIALHYDGENAPKVTAKGQHDVAEQIVSIAEQHGVLLHQDKELTNLLGNLNLGDEIPFMLYTVVAKVIAFAYMLNEEIPKS